MLDGGQAARIMDGFYTKQKAASELPANSLCPPGSDSALKTVEPHGFRLDRKGLVQHWHHFTCGLSPLRLTLR